MKAKGGTWTFGELYAFLTNPRGYIPGTDMTFAGLSRGQQRADVIDFLHTLSDSPLPLPKAAEAGACRRQAGRGAQSRGPGRARGAGEVSATQCLILHAAGREPGRFR